jgi:hypothetical protein
MIYRHVGISGRKSSGGSAEHAEDTLPGGRASQPAFLRSTTLTCRALQKNRSPLKQASACYIMLRRLDPSVCYKTLVLVHFQLGFIHENDVHQFGGTPVPSTVCFP